MPAGRPLKFETPEAITEKADAYFALCIEKNEPITITGLCMALGTYRDVLMDYEDTRGEEFSNAVKRAKLVCENYAENILLKKGHAGAIFALKNYRWKDKTESDVNVSGNLNLGQLFDKANGQP